jgi:hypothetical protein
MENSIAPRTAQTGQKRGGRFLLYTPRGVRGATEGLENLSTGCPNLASLVQIWPALSKFGQIWPDLANLVQNLSSGESLAPDSGSIWEIKVRKIRSFSPARQLRDP